MITKAKKINYMRSVKKDLTIYKYDNSETFELLPSLYNGNVKVPVTIDNNTIYLASQIDYNEISVRFIGIDMNEISQKQLEKKLNNENFDDNFLIEFSIICFSRIYPVTNKTKAFINAYFACIKYYECLYSQLKRTGIYNYNHDLIFFVNIDMVNSFWCEPYIFFGNGSNDILPLTSVDICAHELTHGLIDNTLKLEYRGEAGAINESIADMFGIFVEFFINSIYDVPDWTIGEQVNIKTKLNKSGGFRNFENPLSNQQPDIYCGKHWINPGNLLIDNGGVHINSGVLNFFCYLCSNGKENYTNSLGHKINIKKSPNIFELDDFIKIIYNLLINEAKGSIRNFKQFGEVFFKYVQKFDYSDTAQEHINKCLIATKILSDTVFVPKSSSSTSTCCAM
jgi:Zn-dependent metalloprotease